MFAFSWLLMNRAVDRWFSQPVNQMRDDSNRMALQLAQYTTANARVEAESIATEIPLPVAVLPAATLPTPRSHQSRTGSHPGRVPHPLASSAKGWGRSRPGQPQANAPIPSTALTSDSRHVVDNILRQHEITLQNGFAIVYRNGRAVAGFQTPQSPASGAELKTWIPDAVDDHLR